MCLECSPEGWCKGHGCRMIPGILIHTHLMRAMGRELLRLVSAGREEGPSQKALRLTSKSWPLCELNVPGSNRDFHRAGKLGIQGSFRASSFSNQGSGQEPHSLSGRCVSERSINAGAEQGGPMLAAWGMTRPASPWESLAHPNWKARGILSRWGRLLLQGTEGTGDVQEAPGSMRFWSQ